MIGPTELTILVLVVALVVLVPRLRQIPESLINERELGAQALAQIRSQHRVVTCEEPVVKDVLGAFERSPGLRVARLRALEVERPGLNAAALADGTVVLWTGLVDALAHEQITRNELAGVLAHELAHIQLGHGRQRAARDLMTRPIVGWLGRFGGLLGGWLVDQGMLLLRKGASREAELEADALAVSLLQRAGFPPSSLARFLERLAAMAPQEPEWSEWMSTHPHVTRRLQALHERGAG